MLDVSPQLAQRVLRHLRDGLPSHLKIMPIGGTVMQQLTKATVTKDVDIVIAVVGKDIEIPTAASLRKVLSPLLENVTVRKDQTCVEGYMDLGSGHVHVEAIRGRRKGGYFIGRAALKRIVALATERDGILHIPAEALAFLKAWAAHDQAKLVETGRDEKGFHRHRHEAFIQDVRDIREAVLSSGDVPDTAMLEDLLTVCGPDRRRGVETVLFDAGWIDR